MNSDTQPNPKANHLKSSLFTFFIGAILVIGIALLNRDTPQFDRLECLSAGFFIVGLVAFLPFLRLKFWGIFALLAIVSASMMAVLTRQQNPQVSSLSFLCALFLLFGVVMSILIPRLQTFLYDRGFRGIGFDVSSQDGATGGNWSDAGWGGGDCGSDGGGGDCSG